MGPFGLAGTEIEKSVVASLTTVGSDSQEPTGNGFEYSDFVSAMHHSSSALPTNMSFGLVRHGLHRDR